MTWTTAVSIVDRKLHRPVQSTAVTGSHWAARQRHKAEAERGARRLRRDQSARQGRPARLDDRAAGGQPPARISHRLGGPAEPARTASVHRSASPVPLISTGRAAASTLRWPCAPTQAEDGHAAPAIGP